tara:strand:+ start:818 stop:1102 length:285 start_codon:yes stop_codon:yes gene_type:complete
MSTIMNLYSNFSVVATLKKQLEDVMFISLDNGDTDKNNLESELYTVAMGICVAISKMDACCPYDLYDFHKQDVCRRRKIKLIEEEQTYLEEVAL